MEEQSRPAQARPLLGALPEFHRDGKECRSAVIFMTVSFRGSFWLLLGTGWKQTAARRGLQKFKQDASLAWFRMVGAEAVRNGQILVIF